jgi:hypothetical protein
MEQAAMAQLHLTHNMEGAMEEEDMEVTGQEAWDYMEEEWVEWEECTVVVVCTAKEGCMDSRMGCWVSLNPSFKT